MKHASFDLRVLFALFFAPSLSQDGKLSRPLVKYFDHLAGCHDSSTCESECIILKESVVLEKHLEEELGKTLCTLGSLGSRLLLGFFETDQLVAREDDAL